MKRGGYPRRYPRFIIGGARVNTAVFDLETNGMSGSSVLSASSIVFDDRGAILGVFNRFYFPLERFNDRLVRVHNLTPARLAALRKHAGRAAYFVEDWQDLLDFWDTWDVAGVVVHNLRFDISFLPEISQSAFRWWCSMRGLTAYCAIPKRHSSGAGAFKWPRLGEAADIVCNGPAALAPSQTAEQIENIVGEGCAHMSLCDCFELYRIVSRIALHRGELLQFAPFTASYRPPKNYVPMEGIRPRKDSFTAEVLAYEKKLRSVVQ